MSVEEIARKHGFGTAKEELDKRVEHNIRVARKQYLDLLKVGLEDWRMLEDDEVKRMNSMIRAIDKYLAFLEDKID